MRPTDYAELLITADIREEMNDIEAEFTRDDEDDADLFDLDPEELSYVV